jgi:hypothetical protein
LVPFTVKVKAPLPAVALEGTRDVIVGTGFSGGVMVKSRLFDVPPPGAGLKTVTATVAALRISLAPNPSVLALAMSSAEIEAVSWVLLT